MEKTIGFYLELLFDAVKNRFNHPIGVFVGGLSRSFVVMKPNKNIKGFKRLYMCHNLDY